MASITPEEIKALVGAKIKGQGTAVDMGSVLPAILNGLADNITDVESSIIDIGNENKIHFVKTTHIDYPTISKSKDGDIAILYDSQKWMFTFWTQVGYSWVQMNSIPIYAQESDLPGDPSQQGATIIPNPGSLALVGNIEDGFELYTVGDPTTWVKVGKNSGGGGGGGDDDSVFINKAFYDLMEYSGPWSYFIETTQLGITEEEFTSICKGVSSVSFSDDSQHGGTQPIFMKSFKMGSSYGSENNLTYGYGYAGIKNPERPSDGMCYVGFAMKEDPYSPEYNEYFLWVKEN